MRSALRVLRELFQPLYLAAYVAWLAVLLVVLATPADQFVNSDRNAALIVLIVFLAAFVGKGLQPQGCRHWSDYPLLAVEGLAVLALCFLWPRNMAPVLAIIFIADCAMMLSATALITVALTLNIALWVIVVAAWKVSQPWLVLLSYFGFQMFAALTAWYARRSEQTATDLRETNAHLLATRSLLEESARDGERLRLARELHDVAGHKLTALKLNLAALERNADASTQASVKVVSQLATELLDDIRGVVTQIRQHDGLDIRRALELLIAPLPAPRIHLDVHADARVDSVAQADTLLRVVQEALTNIVRHAHAANAWITLERVGDVVKLSIRDDGRGEVPLREGFGLKGMRERLALVAGGLEISRRGEAGVVLDITMPLH
ncbi:MAG TPA: sensor histidine kinase [Steroidobacteraceae bacterium]|nr:sensor histidine kinase [Steroidobacteraceae bacterium]